MAEAAYKAYSATDPLWSARFRVALARVYLYQGRSQEVVTILQQPLPANADLDLTVRKDLLLAVAEAHLGNAGLAAQRLGDAQALHPQAALHAEMLGMEGSVALEQNRLDDAEKLFQTALNESSAPDTKFLQMQMWMNLGVTALHFEHFDSALERFSQASKLAQSLGARLALEKALGSLGWTYFQTGDFSRALLNAQDAEVQAASLGATLDEVRWLTNAGMSQFQLGDFAAARISYEKSLHLSTDLRNAEEMLDAHVALAYLFLHQKPEEAEVHIREVIRLADLRQDTMGRLNALLLKALLFTERGQFQAAETSLLDLVKHAGASPSIQWEAENTLASVYVKQGRDQDADRWFQRAIATFHHQRLSLKSVELELPFLENGSDLYLGYMEHLIQENRTDEALKVLDDSHAETLAEGLSDSSNGTSANLSLTRLLAARLHATILVYCLRPRTSFLWAINAKNKQFYTLPGSETILPFVARHTQSILASKDLLTQKDSTGRQLFDALVKPAADLLTEGRRVFVIADNGLSGLNFETLIPPGNQPHYWIEDVAITNARSLRLLSSLRAQPVRRGSANMLLIGDPIYHAAEYPALPHAAVEVAEVSSHFPGDRRTIFTGAQASPATYSSNDPGSFDFIHFVAHATANQINPLDSAIILSRPSSGSSDSTASYKLYARDILQRPLHADLVTLSSCYGSGTRNYSGEGVVGLVWAFLRAGAHSVIGAMWEVSDVSTPQLMDSLYTQLLNGSAPDEALRSAKLTMLHGDSVFRKPLYWASFQLYTGR
jgi:CHAT domain-containing protein/Tfp pilus assembly protein PilF